MPSRPPTSRPGPNAPVDEHVIFLERLLKLPSKHQQLLITLMRVSHRELCRAYKSRRAPGGTLTVRSRCEQTRRSLRNSHFHWKHSNIECSCCHMVGDMRRCCVVQEAACTRFSSQLGAITDSTHAIRRQVQ